MQDFSLLQSANTLGWCEGRYRDDYDPWRASNQFTVNDMQMTTAGIFAGLDRDHIDASTPLGRVAIW